MPVSVEYKDPIIWICMSGSFEDKDIVDALAALTALEEPLAITPARITDTTLVDDYKIGFDEILTLATHRRALQFPNSFKSAIITANEEQTGYARMFQTLNTNPQIEIKIFPDCDSALAWITNT
jgi:hypothetical protein